MFKLYEKVYFRHEKFKKKEVRKFTHIIPAKSGNIKVANLNKQVRIITFSQTGPPLKQTTKSFSQYPNTIFIINQKLNNASGHPTNTAYNYRQNLLCMTHMSLLLLISLEIVLHSLVVYFKDQGTYI